MLEDEHLELALRDVLHLDVDQLLEEEVVLLIETLSSDEAVLIPLPDEVLAIVLGLLEDGLLDLLDGA